MDELKWSNENLGETGSGRLEERQSLLFKRSVDTRTEKNRKKVSLSEKTRKQMMKSELAMLFENTQDGQRNELVRKFLERETGGFRREKND